MRKTKDKRQSRVQNCKLSVFQRNRLKMRKLKPCAYLKYKLLNQNETLHKKHSFSGSLTVLVMQYIKQELVLSATV